MHQDLKHKIDTFLEQKSELPKIIVIYGPTASGKTGLSIEVARYLGSEVISVDARQLYRHMNIGTGKVTKDEMQGIHHHMLDIIDPSEPFSVVDFRNHAEPILGAIWNQRKIPILCGGTGLYIDSLIFERTYPSIEADWTRREELEQFRLEHGNKALWEKLNAIDPNYAKTLHHNDRHYIIRGIEVFEKTGKSKAETIDEPVLKYDTLFLTSYNDDRKSLYERINLRVQGMFDTGLINEVQYIMDTFGSDCPGLATIGYKEVVGYLKGELSLEDCIIEVQQHNRNYAKRQITWNKKYGKRDNHVN